MSAFPSFNPRVTVLVVIACHTGVREIARTRQTDKQPDKQRQRGYRMGGDDRNKSRSEILLLMIVYGGRSRDPTNAISDRTNNEIAIMMWTHSGSAVLRRKVFFLKALSHRLDTTFKLFRLVRC